MVNIGDGSPQPIIREPLPTDLPQLRPILEHWIRDRETGLVIPDEVEGVLSTVDDQIEGHYDRYFLVAEDPNGQTVGLMGLRPVSEAMIRFTRQPHSYLAGELVNANVSPESREQGIGRQLVRALETKARAFNFDELVVNSGPRYKETGWAFWTKMYGKHVGTAKDLYGPGGDARVWRSEKLKG